MSQFMYQNQCFTLVIWSNKNSSIFDKACKNVSKVFKHKETIGIVYHDFDTNGETETIWKFNLPNIKIYSIAPRRYTVKMDDKINLSQYMGQSKYIPRWYLNYNDIQKILTKSTILY